MKYQKKLLKTLHRRITAFALLIAFAISAFNVTYSTGTVEAASSMKTLKKSDYKKMIQGNLTMQETKTLLALITDKNKSLTKKAIYNRTKAGGYYGMMFTIFRDRLQTTYDNNKHVRIVKLSRINKLLSSYTTFRYKKNKKYSEHLYSDSKNLYIGFGERGYSSYVVVKSAKYNSKRIEIRYELHDDLVEENAGHKVVQGKFKATFTVLKNGKYRLVNITKLK